MVQLLMKEEKSVPGKHRGSSDSAGVQHNRAGVAFQSGTKTVDAAAFRGLSTEPNISASGMRSQKLQKSSAETFSHL
jgi:hypothetical protein